MIRCECGGEVVIEEASYSDNWASETYRCTECKATGTYRFDEQSDQLNGCLVNA